VPVLAVVYTLLAAVLLIGADRLPWGVVGAVCGGGCGGTTLLGVRLEWFGIVLMGFVAVAWWRRHTAWPLLALLHAGASMAFAASQWLGLSPWCALCQGCAAASLALGAAAVVSARPTAMWGGGAAAAGLVGVLLMWPLLVAPVAEASSPDIDEPVSIRPTPIPADGSPAVDPPAVSGPHVLALSLYGSPMAEWELVVITRIGCPICRRLEDRTMPALLAGPVAEGRLRVRYLFTARSTTPGVDAPMLATAALSLAAAGAPLADVVKEMMAAPTRLTDLATTLATIGGGRWADAAARHHADLTAGRPAAVVMAPHEELARRLQRAYLDGRTGTPAIVLARRPDWSNPPPPTDVYTFYGFQLPAPLLEFMARAVDPSEPVAPSP
jgi:hypothetical protein